MRILSLILILIVSISAHAVETLSYSGRLVNDNGSPVTGSVNLRFELAYSGELSSILCTQDLNSIELAQGVFHVRLNFPGCNLKGLIAQMPAGDTISIRVKDVTKATPKVYSFQAIHAVPFAVNAKVSDQLQDMGAAAGQVLVWSGTQWAPGTINTSIADGSVTGDMLAGSIPRSKMAAGDANQIVVNDASGNLSSLDANAARTLMGAMASTDVPLCNLPHQKLQMNPGPMFWSCGDDETIDDTKLPLVGGTLTGPLILSGDPGSALEATTKEYVDSAIEAIDPTVTGSVKFKPNAFVVELKASGSTSEDLEFILPPAKGSAGQALVTDGNGNLSWAAPAAADSSSIGGDLTGTVANAVIKTGVVTSDKIADGTITNADIATLADIEQSKIKDLALALSNKENKIVGGAAGEYWDGTRSWVTLDSSKVPENTNLYFTEARARDALSASGPVSYDNTTGVMSFLMPGVVGNLLRSNGISWESWTPNYITSEEDDLQTVTDRGATTTTFSKFSGGASFSKIGVGTDTPVGVLDIQSTTSGILIPRMSEGQRDLIASPTGMQIYNTTTNKINFHDGTSWKALGVAGSGVQSVTTGTGLVAATITDTGTINVDVGTSAGKIPQLDGSGKLSSSVETDPTVQAFAKAALPNCGVGQVLKSNGTTFSCVADVDTFLVADGSSLVTSGSTISVKAEGILDTNLKGISASCSAGQILLTNGLGAFYCGNRNWGEFAGGIFYNSGSVAIGGVTADSKAILDLQSTTKGFLPPRMTTAQRDGILTPTPGLMIYNNSTNTLQYFNNTKWIDLYGGTVVLDSGTISGTVTLSKTITIDQPAVVIFTSYMKGANYPMVTLQLNGVACGQDRSFNDIGNLYSSATCVKDLAVGPHTFRSIYGETSGSVNMDTHTMSWTVIAKNAGGSAAPVAGGGESFWGENGTDLYYTEGNIGLGTSIPDSRLSVNGDISLSGSLKVSSGTFQSELKGNPAASEDLLFILPPGKGTVGQSLVTDGAGNLSWATTTPSDSSISYSKLNLIDGDIPQAKVSGLVTDLSNKEPKIDAGSSLQYIRGDKTLGTLNTSVVPEGTNKYFTEDRVRGTFLDGYLVGAAEPILFTDTLLGAIGKLQAQISESGKWSKNSSDVYYNSGNVGIGTTTPAQKLSVNGVVESTLGGFKFPDGTTQTTASTSSNYGVQFKLGSFSSPAAVGDVTISGLGFKPSHVRFWAQNNRSGAMNAVSTSFCTGSMTENYQMSYYAYANTPAVRNLTYNDRVIACSAADAVAIQVQASYVSMNPDGFTLNFSPTLSGWTIYYEATGGSTVANAGSGTANTIPVWTSSTGLGSSPLSINSDNVGIGTTSPAGGLHVEKKYTVASGGEEYGQFINTSFEAPSINWKAGLRTNTRPSMASGTLSKLVGQQSLISSGVSGGTTTEGMAFWGRIDVAPGQIMSNAYGLFLENGSGAGNAVNQYGLFIQNLTSGTTQNFAVYTAGSTKSYFGGNVGVGTTAPSEKLHVIGNILASGTVTPSDIRLKKNFQPVENALEKINTLQSVTYDWKEPEKHGEDRQIGVIAQEVKEVFPEAVRTTNDGFLAVSYQVLVSPLIAAVKELYQKFVVVEADLAVIRDENRDLKLENQKIKDKNLKLESENIMIKAYLCEKDANAPFCKSE